VPFEDLAVPLQCLSSAFQGLSCAFYKDLAVPFTRTWRCLFKDLAVSLQGLSIAFQGLSSAFFKDLAVPLQGLSSAFCKDLAVPLQGLSTRTQQSLFIRFKLLHSEPVWARACRGFCRATGSLGHKRNLFSSNPCTRGFQLPCRLQVPLFILTLNPS